jgi:uncharacterized protein YndB with AHSA1/START domain
MSFVESDPVDGVLGRTADGRPVLRFERRLRHPVERVWAALTTPAQLRHWWGAADELDLTPGGRIVVRWLNEDAEGNQVVLHGAVTRIEPPTLVEYDTDVHGVLRFELRPAGDDGQDTLLRFSSTVEFPEGGAPMAAAGWHLHLAYLATALAGGPTDLVDLPMQQWQRWYELYRQQLA